MAAGIAAGATFKASAPRVLFTRTTPSAAADVTADGRRFLFVASDPAAARNPISMVLDWTALLGKRQALDSR